MDARQSRRLAEKQARELISQRANLVGDLAIAQTERDAALKSIDEARKQGRQLIQDAEARAVQLHQAARENAETAERTYSDYHASAVAGGWSSADLEQLGYAPPARRNRPRPVSPSTTADGAAPAGSENASTADGHAEAHQQPGDVTARLPA